MNAVIGLGLSPDDRRTVAAAIGRHRGPSYFSTIPAVQELTSDQALTLICDARLLRDQRLAGLIEHFDSNGCPPTVIVRTPLRARLVVDLGQFIEESRIDAISITGQSSLADLFLTRDAASVQPDAIVDVFRTIATAVPQAILELGLAAAVLGYRRTRLLDFSRFCGISARTVEWRCNEAEYMPPATLLAWSFCLHAAWQLDLAQASVKRVAMRGGFDSSSAFARFVKRVTRWTPRELNAEGFGGVRNRFLIASARESARRGVSRQNAFSGLADGATRGESVDLFDVEAANALGDGSSCTSLGDAAKVPDRLYTRTDIILGRP